MREIILYIEAPDGRRQQVALEDEISIGRTNLARVAVDDAQLSRVHATLWREGDDVWIQDENSTNGTFVNDDRITGERKLSDRDEILLGSETRIFVESSRRSAVSGQPRKENSGKAQPINEAQTNVPPSAAGNP
ncbi:MAG TPA: FHA domain-containing protein, partial [Pyrinomonadaceae bacterium]